MNVVLALYLSALTLLGGKVRCSIIDQNRFVGVQLVSSTRFQKGEWISAKFSFANGKTKKVSSRSNGQKFHEIQVARDLDADLTLVTIKVSGKVIELKPKKVK